MSSTKIPFVKLQSAGSDFVVINGSHRLPFDVSQFATRVCDRHLGVGAECLLVLEGSKKGDFALRTYSADGVETQSEGGIRCLARFIYSNHLVNPEQRRLDIESNQRVVGVEVIGRGDRIRIDMGQPVFDPTLIPAAAEGEQIGIGLVVDGRSIEVSVVGVGSPHCVVFVPSLVDAPVAELGKILASHSFFPEGTNVEFVQIEDRANIRMRAWQQGLGETLAFGEGSCAAVAAGVRLGRLDRSVHVHTKAGEFHVQWHGDSERLFLTGPAHEVFRGEIDFESGLGITPIAHSTGSFSAVLTSSF
ncbi:MAG: diaminopimelate epimerase [Deltaproteobacteria bacterium]|nr:diaminopimelate epimerase [Deltaproteobacteria bacterium]